MAAASIALLVTLLAPLPAHAVQRAGTGDPSQDPFVQASKVMNASGTLPSFVQFAPANEPTLDTFIAQFVAHLPLSPEHALRQMSVQTDELGETHYRMAQIYRGVRVLGSEYIVHVKDGMVRSANGTLAPDLNLDPTPTLAQAGALTRALELFGAERYMWEDDYWTNNLRERTRNPNATWYPEGELVWSPTAFGMPGTPNYVLAWQFDIHAASPMTSKRLLIDARTGALVGELPLESNCSSATVNTVFNGNRTIFTDNYSGPNFRPRDDCQSAEIRVRDWNSTTTTASPLEITNTTNTWTTMNERFAGSVLWCTKQAYDYYLNIHGRSSYDNSNGDVDGYINAIFSCTPPPNPCYTANNASMSFTGGTLKVGLSNAGTLANCYATVDILGHEYTHAVTGATAALMYQNESGALNESFSDIFGEMVERRTEGSNDWLMGSERSSGAIRDLSNPKGFNQPDTYLGTNWYSGTADNGGVHTNSGVQNYWFYLLANGGSGTNDNGWSYSVTGIGINNARSIAYRTLTMYLGPNSTYTDARTNSIAAAADLFGNGSAEQTAVIRAWRAVGIDPCQVTCPGTQTASNAAGQCGANVNFSVTDNGMCYTVNVLPGSGSFFPVGNTSVTATSRSGATCSFNVHVDDTEDPTVSCPSPISVECTSHSGTPKTDPAIAAFLAAFSASDNCPGVVKSNNAPNVFPEGATTVTFTATDDAGNTNDCTADVTVVDTTPPDLTCPSMLVLECNSHCDPSVGGVPDTDPDVVAWLASFSATDICDATLDTSLPHPTCFTPGDTPVTFTATDDAGNSSSCQVIVRVVDTTPPDITVVLDRTTLWPPNHKMVPIHATVTVTDVCDPNPTFQLVSVTSNEPDDGLGDGDTPNDVQDASTGTADLEFSVRSERSGGGTGRVYTVRYRATDDSGNTSDATAEVRVTHDQPGNALVMAGNGYVDDGTEFVEGAATFALVIRTLPPSPDGTGEEVPIGEAGPGQITVVPIFDARTVIDSRVLVGNLAGELRPERVGLSDVDGDGYTDLVGIFDVAATRAIAAASAEDDGPVGLHYTLADGRDFLVDDIRSLGAPLSIGNLEQLAVLGGSRAGAEGGASTGEPATESAAKSADATPSALPAPASPAPILEPATSNVTGILSVHPVPMNGRAFVALGLERAMDVQVAVYDLRGARVRTLWSGSMNAGRHQLEWDARDDQGAKMRSGVYFIRMIAGGQVSARRTILMP